MLSGRLRSEYIAEDNVFYCCDGKIYFFQGAAWVSVSELAGGCSYRKIA